MAAAAHPDDIEMMMAGTMIMLKRAGYELHYMNIANGSCGSVTMNPEETARVRTLESRNAASLIGATYHEPIVNDLEIVYEKDLASRLCFIVRQVRPEILLLPSPQDYMEDHMNSSRLMVTAAFCRNMPNYPTIPPSKPADNEMAVYHALPYGLRDHLRNQITPDFFVDVAGVFAEKREMLACHKSQKEWLDRTQGLDNYLITMQDMSAEVGEMSGKFSYAEGWRRHSHLGFAREEFDPLRYALAKHIA
jgi:LmbE family N-acetylglucosaminyl deacetylase